MAIAVISDPDLKASFEGDGDVLLMDSRTGAEIGVRGSGRWMASDLCTVTVGGEALLAGGCSDGTIQLREPLTGKQVRVLNAIGNRLARYASLRLAAFPCSPAPAGGIARSGDGIPSAASTSEPSGTMSTPRRVVHGNCRFGLHAR